MSASSDTPPPPAAEGDSLSAYRAKRSPDRSPEPVGIVSPIQGRSFVVHKHAARHLHFDLRLEMDGVLRSWAVPRGPSYDMSDKRLAVHVEDHPLEYGEFEGTIPTGNYGAGGMIVWDRGAWVPLEDPREGLETGKLLFELHGYKLRGKWTLVKIKKSAKDWLLIKERDEWVRSPGDQFDETSVLSGLTVEEMKAGLRLDDKLRDAVVAAEAPAGMIDPRRVELQLAEPSEYAFTRDGWLFELKLDGYRLLATKSHGEALLLSRNGNDYTAVFPEVARAIKAMPIEHAIIDGEVVVLDAQGKPNFSRLQQRGALRAQVDIRRAAVERPATFYAFDFLAFGQFDLRTLPLFRRKELLALALPSIGPVRLLEHIEREGEMFLGQVAALGLEGTIAKKRDAPYRGGRGANWLKIKAERTADFVIVGFTEPKGNRSHFGALQLADVVGGGLSYAGRVGTGFNDSLLAQVAAMLAPLVRPDPPCMGPLRESDSHPLPADAIPETKTTTWVNPVYVCEVRFREWTPDGVLRHTSLLRLRNDKDPHECTRQGFMYELAAPERGEAPSLTDVPTAPAVSIAAPPKDAPSVGAASSIEKTVTVSNSRKVYWPADGYTKGDMVDYYRAISPWMLPYLRNRPLVLTRFPDGIDGKSFYQKDAPDFTPEWMRTVPIWSTDTQRDIRYFVCDDIESLTYIANMGSIPLHIWSSRVGSLELPDWCVMDLDPKAARFSEVIRTAIAVRRLCESIQLPSYVKTTGKTGLHILLPLGRQCTYEQSRTLGELLAHVLLRDISDIATIERQINRRGDKVYLDYLQNRHGQVIVAPFSVRPLPGATVSMPLRWDEVNDTLDPRAFTIRNAVDRLEALGGDPMAGALEEEVNLTEVLERLTEVLANAPPRA